VRADRNGIWLLLFFAPVAARTIRPARRFSALSGAAALASVTALCFALVRGPISTGASSALIARTVALAHGSPVLAGGGIDEQIALAGGRIWAGDPIDAFSRADQGAYLSWLAGQPGSLGGLSARVSVVLVQRRTAAARLMAQAPAFVAVGGDRLNELYQRIVSR
jgi:hypothetical protein